MDLIIGLASIGISIWVSFIVLKSLFIGAKKFLGWIGPFIVSILPSSAMYMLTAGLFDHGTTNASLTGLITAITLGTIFNSDIT